MTTYVPLLVGVLSGSALVLLRKRIGTARVCLLLLVWLLAADSSLPTLQYGICCLVHSPSQRTWLNLSKGIPMCVQLSAYAVLVYGYWKEKAEKPRLGHCPNCGYDLAGNVSGVCPECGKKEESKCYDR